MTYIIKAIETVPLYPLHIDDDDRTVITKDKIYETDGFYKSIGDHLSDDLVKIMCDDGYLRHLKLDLFIRIDVLRDEKLNELLNDTVNDTVNEPVN